MCNSQYIEGMDNNNNTYLKKEGNMPRNLGFYESLNDIPIENQINCKKWYKLGYTKKEAIKMHTPKKQNKKTGRSI